MAYVLVGVLFVAAIVVAALQELSQWARDNPAEWVPWVAGVPPYLGGMALMLYALNRIERSWGGLHPALLWRQWAFRLGLLLFIIGVAILMVPEYLLPLLEPPPVVPVLFPTPSPPG